MMTHNKAFEKALKNPKKTKWLYLYLDQSNHSLLENLDQFVHLESLTIQDKNSLNEFPRALLALSHLKTLSIIGANFTSLPEEIGQLKNLYRLDLENVPIEALPESIGLLINLTDLYVLGTKIKQLPDSITQLTRLERFDLGVSKLEILPTNMGDLKALEKLSIDSPFLKELPESFGQLQQLKSLIIRGGQLKKLPESFSNLTELNHLNCSENELTCLPKDFGKLKKLSILHLNNNQFNVFPKELCKCTSLEVLEFNENKLTTLPEELEQLKLLRQVGFESNAFKFLPAVLLDWGNTFALKHGWAFRIDAKLYDNSKLFELLGKKAFKALSRAEKVIHFKIFTQNRTKIASLDPLVVRKALNAKLPSVADSVLAYLTQHAAQSLAKGAEIFVLGKTSKEKTTLKKQMVACGLKYVTKLSAQTTHVLVSSRGNKKLDQLPEPVYWKWLAEPQLIAYLDQVQPSFLMEAASTNKTVDQVRDLIMTLKEENMSLALELITGGGLPVDLMTEVFIVYKLSSDAKLRKKAKKLLQQKGSSALQDVLRKRTSLRFNKSFYGINDYLELYRRLENYTEATEIEYGKLAFAVAMVNRLGYSYALDTAPMIYCKQLVQEVLAQSNRVFKLPYGNNVRKFPLALLDFPELQEVEISVARKVLDRNGNGKLNKSFFVPTEIKRLENLESLAITGIAIKDLPVAAISQLKNLKTLTLQRARNVDYKAIKKALPNCKIKLY